jgi:hypothetical protein
MQMYGKMAAGGNEIAGSNQTKWSCFGFIPSAFLLIV